MTMRKLLLGFTVSGLTATAVAQTAAVSESWAPVGHLAQTITGRVTFSPTEITFQNGKSLSLTQGAQMLFRPEAKAKKVTADLFRVTQPDDPVTGEWKQIVSGQTCGLSDRLEIREDRDGGCPTEPGTVLRDQVQRRFAR